MSVLFRHSFTTAMFNRFLKIAIATLNVMSEVYNGGFLPRFFIQFQFGFYGFFKQFGQNPKLTRPRTFWGLNLVFNWRKISYFKFTYIFPLFLLFISTFSIHTLKLARWFLLTMKHWTLGENLPLLTSFIKFDVATATFKNLLNMAVLEECLNKTGIEKLG